MSLFLRIVPFFFLSTVALAQPVRTFVSVQGSDANPCSRTLPCRQFAAATAAVANGGEVVALDSGGYGPVTLNKSLTMLAQPAAHAAIAPTTGDAIAINASTTDVVVLRNLYLNGQGGAKGVHFTAGGALHVQNLTASGFTEYGLYFNAPAEVFIVDSIFRQNNNSGVHIQAMTGTALGSLDRVHLNGNGNFTGVGSCAGLTAARNSRVTAARTVAVNNFRGFQVYEAGAELNLDRASAMNGVVGLFSNGTSTTVMRVSNSTVYGNTLFGIEAQTPSQILTRENNTVVGNAAAETFSGNFPAR